MIFCQIKPFLSYLCRFKSGSHVDMCGTHRLLCFVCGPADFPTVSSILSSPPAAHRPPERGGGSQPAAGAGPRQPQPASSHSVFGYGTSCSRRADICSARQPFPPCYLASAGHWCLKWLCTSFQVREKPASPFSLAPNNNVEPPKENTMTCSEYPPSSTPQRWRTTHVDPKRSGAKKSAWDKRLYKGILNNLNVKDLLKSVMNKHWLHSSFFKGVIGVF